MTIMRMQDSKMTSPKSIILKSIPRSIADPFIKEHHYSKSVVKNSQLSFGVFLDNYLHGVIQHGPSMDKSKVIGLVDIKRNKSIRAGRSGIAHDLSSRTKTGTKLVEETSAIDGYMIRYIKLIDKSYQLTVPIIDYDKIEELGVGMYLGRKK